MPTICLYMHLHQPYRLADYSVLDIGTSSLQFFTDRDRDSNAEIFRKVAHKSYYPMLELLLHLCRVVPKFRFALSISGVFLEQAREYEPKIVELLQQIHATGKLEIIGETYHHSLASLYSPAEFAAQVHMHEDLIQSLFGMKPQIFRNTELIYSNDIAHLVSQLGYKGMLTEAVPRYLGDRPKTRVYWSNTDHKIPLLLKHAELSDDIAFRFSNKGWASYPLTVDKYMDWVEIYNQDEYVNLFMDFETFGEHQWADTGIFEFFSHFVHTFCARDWNAFVTPSQVLVPIYETEHPVTGNRDTSRSVARSYNKKKLRPAEKITTTPPIEAYQIYSVTAPISWADIDRDITAWRDNPLQHDTLETIYGMEQKVLSSNNYKLIEEWRKLQTSDHFYYMCTKWAADGDVHAYFSPYDSPYEAYRKFSIALAHLQEFLL